MFYSTSNVLGQIKQGMSPEETTKILGEPEYRRLDYGLEEWEYKLVEYVPDAIEKINQLFFKLLKCKNKEVVLWILTEQEMQNEI